MNLNCKGEYKLFGGLIKLTNSSVLSVFYGNYQRNMDGMQLQFQNLLQ
jgi:hypothetical protein